MTVSTVPLQIFEIFPALTGFTERELVSQSSSIKSTQITKCAVGDMTTISEKTSLNQNVIANGCTVQPKTRINNSVLMDGVTVEETYVKHGDCRPYAMLAFLKFHFFTFQCCHR